MSASCDVNLNTNDCEHPPGLENDGYPAVRTRCFACGQRACLSCSLVQPWQSYGRRRVCNDCAGRYQDEPLPLARGAHVVTGTGVVVWHLDNLLGTSAVLDRVDTSGSYTRRSVPVSTLTVLGEHTERSDAREKPQNCQQCGCFREVAS